MTDQSPPNEDATGATPENVHELRTMQILTAMVSHPIQSNGLPDKGISPGFHKDMVDPIWEDLDAEILGIYPDTIKRFDVEVLVSLPEIQKLRNSKALDLFDFSPTLYSFEPDEDGGVVEFGGTHTDGREYGFRVYMGDTMPEDEG